MENCLGAVRLEKSFHKKKVVDDVSITVEKGEIVGLLGPNGAGKTTTFSLILGLVQQDGGEIYLDGEDITGLPMYVRARKGLCLLPQEPSAFRKLSVEDNLLSIVENMSMGSSRGNGTLRDVLTEMGLMKLSKVKAYTLSGGERRRLEIARALVTNPEYMLLDEPFTGIDPLAILDLQEVILSLKKKGIGVLITDHSVRETLKITDRAYIIDKGKILAHGTSSQLVSSDKVRKIYLGDEFDFDG
jgi:lipopolysaccharide export system ATP-binding protein